MKKGTLKTITRNIAMVAVILGFSTMYSNAQTSIASEARTILNEQMRDFDKLDPADHDYFGLADPRDAIVLHEKIVDIAERAINGRCTAGELATLKKLRSQFVKSYSDNYRADPYYTQAHDNASTLSWKTGFGNSFSRGADVRPFIQ